MSSKSFKKWMTITFCLSLLLAINQNAFALKKEIGESLSKKQKKLNASQIKPKLRFDSPKNEKENGNHRSDDSWGGNISWGKMEGGWGQDDDCANMDDEEREKSDCGNVPWGPVDVFTWACKGEMTDLGAFDARGGSSPACGMCNSNLNETGATLPRDQQICTANGGAICEGGWHVRFSCIDADNSQITSVFCSGPVTYDKNNPDCPAETDDEAKAGNNREAGGNFRSNQTH